MTAQRTYGGVSADERRAQRRTALLDAALDIIGTQGLAKLTVSGLCARAGLNERYYYESFDSREAVLTGVIDRIAEEMAAAILDALREAPDDSRAMARAAITAGIRLLTDDPRKAKVAFIDGLATPELRARSTTTARVFARLVAAEGVGFYGIPGPDAPDADTLHADTSDAETSDADADTSDADTANADTGTSDADTANANIGTSNADADTFDASASNADTDPAVDFRATYLVGGLIHTLTGWIQGDLAMTRDELIDHTTDVFVLLGEDLAGRQS
ncbi:TetR/AcrR family transcriptional regulator [Nocardia bovistercoris]|uniref:TetR/AcrR family transcriptional regulator n=1 Tax=Nocardia bovistercoris TaxID=2785916 RepID=UPI002FCD3B0E